MSVEVKLNGVSFTYHSPNGETRALDGIDLTIASETFVSIVGPSGCGKSTLLSLIAGLLAPTAGEVRIAGVPVNGPSPRVGYMLQQDYLLPWRTVLQNAGLGLEVQGRIDDASLRRVHGLLEGFGLGPFKASFPAQLSGGMRQRAALTRTLALEPDVLLLDEPFAALDFQTRLRLEEEVAGTLRARRKTAILVTHDISEALVMSDRVIVLSRRPARIKLDLMLELGNHSALRKREHPAFQAYFRQIWRELDVHT